MTYLAVSALINFIAILLLGLIVLVKNYKNRTNIIFSVFAFTASLWSLSYFLWQISLDETSALFWSKTLMFFAVFIPVTYLHLVLSFLGVLKEKIKFIIFNYFIFLIFAILDLSTNLFVSNVEPLLSFKFWPIAGPAFSFFLIIWIGYVCYASYLLYLMQKKSTGNTRTQIKYVLLGLIIGFIGGSTNYFLWFRILVPPFGNFLVFIYVALTAYAIIRHRFMDIRLVVARTLTYTLLVIILAILYGTGIFILGSLLLQEAEGGKGQIFVSIFLAVVLTFTFQPLRKFLEKITDRVFFKNTYDPQTLLKELSTIMSTTLQLESLTLRILDKVTQNLRITRSVFVLLSKDEGVVEYIEYEGYQTKPLFEKKDIEPFLAKQRITIFDDLEEGELKEAMRKLNIFSALPLTVQDKKIGVLFLGEKASGDIYSSQDIDVLEILAPQLSIAIQNSREYEEIKRFNITLKDEIEKATKELIEANEKLKELDKLKDEFVSIASHELRTPMTAIKSYAWLLLNDEEKEKLSEKQKLHLERTYNSTERLIKLVNDMLSVSRIEGGRIKINTKLTDLGKLVEDTIQELLPSAEPAKINLVFEKNHETIPPLVCDPDKTKEVLINLIGNAMKFVPQDETGEIKVTSELENDKVVIKVKDNGIGIKDEDFPKLFQKFGIVGNQFLTKNNAQGTGLGLYISKSIIELQGGQMWVESEGENKGASFYFSLPLYAHWSEEKHAPVAQNLAGPQATEIIHTKPPQ